MVSDPPIPRLVRRHARTVVAAVAGFAAVLAAACTSASGRTIATPVPTTAALPPELTPDERIVHALNRLAFGPRPGDVERVRQVGLDQWIEQQLHPETIADPELDRVLGTMPALGERAQALAQAYPPSAVYLNAVRRERGIAANATYIPTSDDSIAMRRLDQRANAIANEAIAARVIRAQLSERQLLEVMTDFWENHFSVYLPKMPSRFAMLEYDRDVIRPRALGRFRDLLGAVAHSPAMLFYLDNIQSQADSLHLTLAEWSPLWTATRRPPNQRRAGLNENYGRELLELHTLGVDGGYTQHDVTDAARILTGWSLYAPQFGGGFVFRPEQHDAEPKTVLGQEFPGGGGVEEGERLLDLLARHPSTARFIALKLARRLVADSPSTALVARAAARFTATDGDIREVVRAIVTSPEFFTRAAYHAKVKSPFELVVSARRALGAGADTTQRTVQLIGRLGEPIWGHLAPNGWPETSGEWMNPGALLQRVTFATDAAEGRTAALRVDDAPFFRRALTLPLDAQVDAIVSELLPGTPIGDVRTPLVAAAAAPRAATGPSGNAAVLRNVIALTLASPGFQRR